MSAASSLDAGLSIRDLRMRYGRTVALDSIDLDLRPGEVLGVAGPNGAGKSTLVRILAGEERADAGIITLGAAPWSPIDVWTEVAVVHQEAQLFPNLTVAENLLAGREGGGLLRPRSGADDQRLMEALGLGPLAAVPLGACTIATQQRVEIARALARNARVFLFDEPNSALTDEESNELFREMHKIAESGCIVILVTHRLSDLVDHAARVVVIRDGLVAHWLEGADLTEEAIARQLVLGGDKAARNDAAARSKAVDRAPLVTLASCTHPGSVFQDVAFAAPAGEIVALMGVEGSGARELLRSMSGLERCAGRIEIGGRHGAPAMLACSAYVPATRQESLYTNLSVGENLLVRLGVPEIAGSGLRLRFVAMRTLALTLARRFMVKSPTITQGIRSLSGGNQQKVAIAQALAREPLLLLLEEPTRGVDIQSKREIYRLLHAFVALGHVVVMYCTEVLEVFDAADRVIVVSDGRLSPSLALGDYAHVEQLATDVTRLERHGRAQAGVLVPG